MLTRRQTEEILRALSVLPSEKVVEVQDFILFLKERYGYEKAVDESDAWTEEDLRDLVAAVLNYADKDWIALQKIKGLNQKIKKEPLKFKEDFSADKARSINEAND